MRKIRVRFAPSPTGPLHIGGVRTALYNYLFAKQHDGTFILRIEDTDSQRFVPGSEQYIIDSLRWCGISPTEGVDRDGHIVETPSAEHPFAPYRQSQRKNIYRKYAEELVEKGYAYYAFDTSEQLAALRKEAESKGETFIYSYLNRDTLKNSLTISPEECQKLLKESSSWTIRFKNPKDKVVEMKDLIRGEISVSTSTLDDKVLWKAVDELPTYHLANIVDDHLMEISHVIRGEEWLPSLPLHYMLYEAFGWKDSQPEFAHLPLLLKPDGKGKLSKRDGDRLGFPVFPLRWVSPDGEVSRGYREDGYYPEAFINIIAMLGWNPGTEQEIFSLEQLSEAFTLDRVVKAGAKFNPEKARWFNQEYLRMRSDEELAKEFLPIVHEKGITNADLTYVKKVCTLMKERAHFITDMWDLTSYFFVAPTSYDASAMKKYFTNDIKLSLINITDFICNIHPFEKDFIEQPVHQYIEENNLPMGQIMNCLRLALIGASKGPGVVDIISIIGPKEFAARMTALLEH